MDETVDIAIVGVGAAGLMAGIWAGRTARSLGKPLRIVLLDGAKTLGAKILVAGGGRCNITHDVVDEKAFAGSSPPAIRKVLRRFDVPQTIQFFSELGVELKREETGKLFPTTDKARTVLDALLNAVRASGVEIRNPWRVNVLRKEKGSDHLLLESDAGAIAARCVILATGGKSLPKTGSDGHGYTIVQSLGHSVTERIFPALVPLTLPKDHWMCSLSGISSVATVEVRSGTGKRLHSFIDSLLCTHFGISGPAALDISRYFIDARMGDPHAQLVINWLPSETMESVDTALQKLGATSPSRWLRGENRCRIPIKKMGVGYPFVVNSGLPQRLAEALCAQCGVDPSAPAHQLTREKRRALAAIIGNTILPITGDRGFAHAEVTAGGVPLRELHLDTMESRLCPGLYIIGEICDVDGRIGGYNFQWAWASGYIAGAAAAKALAQEAVPQRRND